MTTSVIIIRKYIAAVKNAPFARSDIVIQLILQLEAFNSAEKCIGT